MDRMTVREATLTDVFAISALVEDYYARRGAPAQYREVGTWFVAEDANGAIHAAQNRADAGGNDRWILDTYCFNTRAGKVGLSLILENAYAEADRDGKALLGVSEMDNAAMGRVVEKQGWVQVGILRRREPNALRRAV